MTVATRISEATFVYTGTETVFPAGFPALDLADVQALLLDATGASTRLVQGAHFTVARDAGTGFVVVTRVSFPYAAGTLRIWRETDLVQDAAFADGEAVTADVHEQLHDAHVLRLQELQREIARVGAGIFNFDAAGPLASRATYNSAAQNFVFLQTDDALQRPVFYVKLSAVSGDWSGPMIGNFTVPITSAVLSSALAALPTSLPAQPNQAWNNGGVICLS